MGFCKPLGLGSAKWGVIIMKSPAWCLVWWLRSLLVPELRQLQHLARSSGPQRDSCEVPFLPCVVLSELQNVCRLSLIWRRSAKNYAINCRTWREPTRPWRMNMMPCRSLLLPWRRNWGKLRRRIRSWSPGGWPRKHRKPIASMQRMKRIQGRRWIHS